MRSLPEISDKESLLTIQADTIWEAVVFSMSKFTHDSYNSKFMPAEEQLAVMRPVAAAFSSILLTPFPPMKDIYRSKLYHIIYFTTICGFQIYLQQRSIITHSAPYIVQTDKTLLRDAKNNVIKQLTDGIKVYPPINTLIDLTIKQIMKNKKLDRLAIKHCEIDIKKFNRFLPISLLWGYLFSKKTIIEK